MTELKIEFQEIQIKFHSDEWDNELHTFSPTRLVPVLWEGNVGEGLSTYDSMAIIERLHELQPDKQVLPIHSHARARARSLMAAFHSGFTGIRSAMPMNIRSKYPGLGHTEGALRDVANLSNLIVDCKRRHGGTGPYIFGKYSAADAFFTPVMSRFQTYEYALENPVMRELQQTLLSTRSWNSWSAVALTETEFVPEDEPYATAPSSQELARAT